MITLIVVSLATSFLGNMLALAIWLHFDLEGYWEQRRLKHGKVLDDRQRPLFGFAQGLHFQLHAAHKAAEREVAEEYAAAGRATNVEEATESVALVLRSKKERVSDWIDKEYGQLGSVSRRYSSGGAGARAAGTAAGRSADAGGRGRVAGQGRALTR